MNLLKEKDSADMELLVYAVTLINKVKFHYMYLCMSVLHVLVQKIQDLQ